MQRELILAFIVSIDIYLAAAAYCNAGIKIPAFSMTIISFIGAAVLGLSASFSKFLGDHISGETVHRAVACVLILIGSLTIMKSLFKIFKERISKNGDISLKLGKGPVIVRICLDETEADIDHSMVLSAAEAAALAIAGSFDALAIGIGNGGARPVIAALFTFLCGLSALFLGNITGKKISALPYDLSWIGGVFLILFAVFE